jgi:hypothetical protein
VFFNEYKLLKIHNFFKVILIIIDGNLHSLKLSSFVIVNFANCCFVHTILELVR